MADLNRDRRNSAATSPWVFIHDQTRGIHNLLIYWKLATQKKTVTVGTPRVNLARASTTRQRGGHSFHELLKIPYTFQVQKIIHACVIKPPKYKKIILILPRACSISLVVDREAIRGIR